MHWLCHVSVNNESRVIIEICGLFYYSRKYQNCAVRLQFFPVEESIAPVRATSMRLSFLHEDCRATKITIKSGDGDAVDTLPK